MHIPDGYLGPATCGFFYAVMLPIWIAASRIAKKTLKAQQVPMLAVASAFSFVIMMFNVPLPGGSSGHAAGSALLAILLGPWLACIAVTITVVVQALLFGDGGVTAIGANCFNMAFIMSFTGYGVYKFISLRSAVNSKRRVFAAGAAGYIGVTAAALLAGIEFGLQPLFYRTTGGRSLYALYGLNVSVPVMLGGHLLLFGWVEAIVSASVVKYLQRNNPQLLKL